MKKLKTVVCGLMACVMMGSAFGCGCSSKKNRPLKENLDYYSEWLTVDSDYYADVVGSDQDGIWVAKPQGLATVGYLDAPMAMEKDIPLSEGFYTFSVYAAIDNNQYPNADNVMENDMVLQLRVLTAAENADEEKDSRRIIAAQEIYRNDFEAENVFQNISVTFAIPYNVKVDIEVNYLNTATISMEKMSISGVKAESYTRTDYEGYFAESEEDTAVQLDKSKLYYFDLYEYLQPVRDSRWAYDVTLMTSVLQGLVNRSENLLFIRFNGPNSHQYNQDEFWLNYLQQNGQILAGKEVVAVSRPATLLRLFKEYYNGLVIWDNVVPATSNVACTASGVDNLLPVRGLYEDGSMYSILTEQFKLPVTLDLVGMFKNKSSGNISGTKIKSTGSAKNDAYLWAKAKYMDTGKTSPTIMANHLDAFSWDKTGKTMTYYNIQQQTLANKDYYIANKAFFWDLMIWEEYIPNDDPEQEEGTDFATVTALMEKQNEIAGGELIVLGGFVPWWIKYTDKAGEDMPADVASEWKWASDLGTFYAVKDADAYGYTSLANASIYCKVEQPEQYTQKVNRSPQAVAARAQQYLDDKGNVKPGNYLLLYMGDYDAAAWQMMAMPENFTDPNLGQMPLCWPINPTPLLRAPVVANYMYEHATGNDYFVGDHNGFGYTELLYIDAETRPSYLNGTLESFIDLSKKAWQKYDLDFMGFLINTQVGKVQYSDRIEKMISDLAPYGVITNGSTYQTGKVVENTAGQKVVWSAETDAPSGSPIDCQRELVKRFDTPQAANFRCIRFILRSPSYVNEVVTRLKTENPTYNFQVLDPYVYSYLMQLEMARA